MSPELKHALQVIKNHCETPKGKSFYEHMDSASLKQRIQSLKSKFVFYVDNKTINYSYTQYKKKNPNFDGEFTPVELSKKQLEDCIESLQWFKRDIEACISHLKDN